MPLEPGTRLGRYKVVSPLGSGGMGEVYRAEDTRLGRFVALKLLLEGASQDHTALERFHREARAASALNHPNICTLHDLGEHEGRPYLVMEYLEGRTLNQEIAARALPTERVLELGLQMADALAAAHAKGIVHRDVKPGNLFVTDAGPVKVLDFGIAKLAERQQAESDAGAPTRQRGELTSPGAAVGTVAYMSPEQALGKDIDARTDIFSLGAVLYETITGRQAFSGSTAVAVLDSILHRAPIAPVRLNPEVPGSLEEIVNKALEKDRGLRYQSVSELGTDLNRLRRDLARNRTITLPSGGASDAAASAIAPVREASDTVASAIGVLRRHKAILYTGLAGLVVLLGFLSFGRLPGSRESLPPIESIAVLPFQNIGADPETEHLGEGLASGILYRLAELSQLKVIASSSARRYAGQEVDPERVGRDLDVQVIVTGRLAARGEQLSLQVELVDTREARLLWGERYEPTRGALSILEGQIARQVAEALRFRGSAAEIARLHGSHTDSKEAYEAFLRGRVYLERFTQSDVNKALEYFEKAVELAPDFALAHASIGTAHFKLAVPLAAASPEESWRAARLAALRAIELDSSLGMARTVLGSAYLWYDWDWERARQEFELAVRLSPNDPWTRFTSSWYFTVVGRHEDAVASSRRAVELTPLSPFFRVPLIEQLRLARRNQEALAACLDALELDPDFSRGYLDLRWIYEAMEQYEKAVETYEKEQSLRGGDPDAAAELRQSYQGSGANGYWEWWLQRARANRRPGESCINCARSLVPLGELDEALEELELAFAKRNAQMIFLNTDARLDPLHSEPRFQDLLRRMKFPQPRDHSGKQTQHGS